MLPPPTPLYSLDALTADPSPEISIDLPLASSALSSPQRVTHDAQGYDFPTAQNDLTSSPSSSPSSSSLPSGRITKPPYPYAKLIAQAINSTPQKAMTLKQIYQFISDNYPYFRSPLNGWQNSIRHNLSLNKAFMKVSRAANQPGKGNLWVIVPDYQGRFDDPPPAVTVTALRTRSRSFDNRSEDDELGDDDNNDGGGDGLVKHESRTQDYLIMEQRAESTSEERPASEHLLLNENEGTFMSTDGFDRTRKDFIGDSEKLRAGWTGTRTASKPAIPQFIFQVTPQTPQVAQTNGFSHKRVLTDVAGMVPKRNKTEYYGFSTSGITTRESMSSTSSAASTSESGSQSGSVNGSGNRYDGTMAGVDEYGMQFEFMSQMEQAQAQTQAQAASMGGRESFATALDGMMISTTSSALQPMRGRTHTTLADPTPFSRSSSKSKARSIPPAAAALPKLVIRRFSSASSLSASPVSATIMNSPPQSTPPINYDLSMTIPDPQTLMRALPRHFHEFDMANVPPSSHIKGDLLKGFPMITAPKIHRVSPAPLSAGSSEYGSGGGSVSGGAIPMSADKARLAKILRARAAKAAAAGGPEKTGSNVSPTAVTQIFVPQPYYNQLPSSSVGLPVPMQEQTTTQYQYRPLPLPPPPAPQFFPQPQQPQLTLMGRMLPPMTFDDYEDQDTGTGGRDN